MDQVGHGAANDRLDGALRGILPLREWGRGDGLNALLFVKSGDGLLAENLRAV